jgi:hypothetical protein
MSDLHPPAPPAPQAPPAPPAGAPTALGPRPEGPPAYPGPASLPPPDPRRRNRLAVVLAAGAAVLVLVLALAVPALVRQLREEARLAHPGAVDLSAVLVVTGLSNLHTSADVDYPQTPPVGGQHDPQWLDCGAYDAPVRDENAVHDLEHGAVWITYRPDLAAADVDALADVLPQDGLLSPYDGLPAPVVVTVWGRQLRLTGADDARLPLFLERYGAGETAPEPFASCAGGLRSGSGAGGTPV